MPIFSDLTSVKREDIEIGCWYNQDTIHSMAAWYFLDDMICLPLMNDNKYVYKVYKSESKGGSESENSVVPDPSDPFSEEHNTDGSSTGTISSGNAKYVFNPDSSNTLIAATKADISQRFEKIKENIEYNPSAKHRYAVSDKKIAKVSKSGVVTPKKNGIVDIWCEQKVKGGSWTQIGDKIQIYIQLPTMSKKETVTINVGETLNAYEFLSGTTYSPTEWISTKTSVASIDDKGVITVNGKGTTKIIAVYGEGNDSSKKKFKTTLKIKMP